MNANTENSIQLTKGEFIWCKYYTWPSHSIYFADFQTWTNNHFMLIDCRYNCKQSAVLALNPTDLLA